MSEEESQVFRSDEHVEVAAAEGHARKKARAAKGPSDQRAVKDQEGGPSDTRSLRDGSGDAEIRQMHDAEGGAGEADGPSDMRAMLDADGTAVLAGARDGEGPSDARAMRDADGPQITAGARDGEGPSEIRDMRDAEGKALVRQSEDGEGPSDQRKLQDHWADIPDAAGSGEQDTHVEDESATAEAVQEPTEPDMVFMTEENAAPWVLSIHLEERIQNLGAMTSKVSAQLDVLEDAVKRLGKRIGR